MKSLILWWQSISQRERVLVVGGGVLLLFSVVYWGGIAPLAQRLELVQDRINSERSLLTWVQNKADNIVSLRGNSSVQGLDEIKELNQVVPSSTERFNIELIRMQPRDEEMQVWIEPLPFDVLINWIAYLKETQGIYVQFLDISRTDTEGLVEVSRLQLTREFS